MSGLRAEDVKEALELAEASNPWLDDEWRTLATAARLWLASQEQTPDYEAAAKYVEDALDEPAFEMGVAMEPAAFARCVVDAALVGFHPQPDPSANQVLTEPELAPSAPVQSPEVPT